MDLGFQALLKDISVVVMEKGANVAFSISPPRFMLLVQGIDCIHMYS